MPTTIPSRINTGNPQLNNYLEKLRRSTQTYSPGLGAGAMVRRSPTGSQTMPIQRRGGTPISLGRGGRVGDFVIQDASDDEGAKITVTGGNLIFVGLETVVEVDALDATAVADGDKVWIEYGEDWGWTITTGADFPSVIYIPLADSIDVETPDSGPPYVDLTLSSLDWSGGDIVVSEVFGITCAGEDSSVGESPVYSTIETLGGISIASATALNFHDPNLAYYSGTTGIGGFDADGALWYFVFDETPKTKTQKIITNVTWDGTDLKTYYQTLTVFDTGTSNTLDVDITTTPCP